jgi:hypothetical protein
LNLRVLEVPGHPLQVVGEPEVVMGKVRNQLASCVAQRYVPVLITKAWSLGQVVPVNSLVAEPLNHLSGAIAATIADNEQFKIAGGLTQRGRNRKSYYVSSVMRR